MNRINQFVWTVGLVAAAAGSVSADTVYVQNLGANGNVGRGVAVTLSNGLTFASGSTSGVIWAGKRSLLLDGVMFDVFSAELTGINGDGWYETRTSGETQNVLGSSKAAAISRLFGAHDGGKFTSREQTAAFQAMLWEIVYDYDGTEESIDLDSGSVAFKLVNAAEFDSFKASAMRGGSKPGVGLISSGPLNDSFRIVPLPSTAGLTMLGLLGVASVRRRRA